MKQNIPSGRATIDNELDIRGLFRTLWHGKFWIVGLAVVFSLTALLYSAVVKQKWSATAVTDLPTVNTLGSYYTQQQFLRSQDLRANLPIVESGSIMDEAYKEFTRQLSAYDTRRDFWLQSEYYKQRRENDVKADAALLDELINNIQFTPREPLKNTPDSTRLVAETSPDSNLLLREYIDFASQRAAEHLNSTLRGAWQARHTQVAGQVQRQQEVASAIYQRKLKNVEAAFNVAQRQNIDRKVTDVAVDELPDSEMFMLGRPMLQARLENLRAIGPTYDVDYDKNQAVLHTLSQAPVLDSEFKSYRYLRTPEDPVKRDSPRRGFLMVMWGLVGALVGAGCALAHRPKTR